MATSVSAQDPEEESATRGTTHKPKDRANTAIYVTSLPADVTVEEVKSKFGLYGILAESADTDLPRIKLYTDEHGTFKGEALIVYLRPESVPTAIQLEDGFDFRPGQPVVTGPMRVTEADPNYKALKEYTFTTENAKRKGTFAHKDRAKFLKKAEEMRSRLADWDDDEPPVVKRTPSRWDRIVVFKHMFTPEQLAKDPQAAVEIEEDVRESCEEHGTVTKVVLYDEEADGVMTVRFEDAISARNAAEALHGRKFDGVNIAVYVADGTEKFKKRKKQDVDAEEEEERLERFGEALEQEEI